MSARTFGRAIGVPENTTQNYLGPRGMTPKADYLERIVLHFQTVNPWWLLTGQGPAFFEKSEEPRAEYQKAENNSGNMVAVITGGKNKFTTLADCAKENEHLRTQVTLLTGHLEEKERTIQILLKQQA